MRYRLRTLLIVMAAVPIWIYLVVLVPQSTGFGGGAFRFLIAPLVLSGIAAACFWLLRGVSDGLAWSILASPIIALGSLLVVRAVAG